MPRDHRERVTSLARLNRKLAPLMSTDSHEPPDVTDRVWHGAGECGDHEPHWHFTDGGKLWPPQTNHREQP